MKDINIYISTCDKTKFVLKPAIMLMEKYWPIEKSVKILGYNPEGINLPKNYSFTAMKQAQHSIEDWAPDLSLEIEKDPHDFVLFLLDDMLTLNYFDEHLFRLALLKMQGDKRIVRFDLGMDLQSLPCFDIGMFNDVHLVEKDIDGNYWHTTQPSIWRKDYLVDLLKRSTDPWNFETEHKPQYGTRVMGLRGSYIVKTMIESAISNLHPGKFNIMGLKEEDIQWLIDEDIVVPKDLQWGMRKGTSTPFLPKGLYFTMNDLKGSTDAYGVDMYNHYIKRYGNIY